MDIKVDGNEPDLAKDPTGKVMRSEALELWFRDPVEIVEELIGNPQFREVMKYAPERVYADMEGKTQVINEMWTGSWWWEIQVSMRREEAKSSASDCILGQDPPLQFSWRCFCMANLSHHRKHREGD